MTIQHPPANADMVQGFIDGYDLDCPEPSETRSQSYRHGFANGRADKTGVSRAMSFNQLVDLANAAMAADLMDSVR